MKLRETTFDKNFKQTMHEWADEMANSAYTTLFHVYVPYDHPQELENLKIIRQVLKEEFPDSPVIGCSATGEIFNGKIQNNVITVSAMLFEKPSTKIIVRTSYEKDSSLDASKLLKYASGLPNLKAIEVLTAAPYQPMLDLVSIVDNIPENIDIFGAIAVGDETNQSFVFAGDTDLGFGRTALVFYTGEDLHILSSRMFGWKPIGYPFIVTKSEGTVVYELDNKPAYDVYNHYLRIKKDKNFFYNALEFPWEVQDEKTSYIRHAKSVNPDGSIVMSSNIPQGSKIRLTYGDPRRIMDHTRQTMSAIYDFAPQVVNIFNCFGRMLFWADNENLEIQEISSHLPSTGFSALGEVMRYKGKTLLNNLSIVTVAMREGPAENRYVFDPKELEYRTNMPITARLAIFINTITEELMEKNDQLNEMLYKVSHDALTGILNRGAIEREIYEKCEQSDEFDLPRHLIMFDVDDFKYINDNFGHAKGDQILRDITAVINSYVETIPGATFGRWGGEEFMILIYGHPDSFIKDITNTILNKIRKEVQHEMKVTISVGATRYNSLENVMQTLTRVDELLYISKKNGKDQVSFDF